MRITIEPTAGSDPFGKLIAALGAESTWRIAQEAMAKAAQPMLSAMRARIPRRTGATAETLAIRKSTKVPAVLVGAFAPRSHIARFMQRGYMLRMRNGSVKHVPANPVGGWMPVGMDETAAAEEIMGAIEERVMRAIR